MTTAQDSVSLIAPTLGDDVSPIFDEFESIAESQLVITEPDERPDIRWNALLPALRLLRRNRKAPLSWRKAIEKCVAVKDQKNGNPLDKETSTIFLATDDPSDAAL